MSEFYAGQIVFDQKRTDPTNDLLVVVNPDVGTLGDLTGETYRLVKHNDTNKKLHGGKPVPDDEQCIGVAYIENGDDERPSVGDTVYTFPAYRLATVESDEGNAINGYHPYQWSLARFLGELVEAVSKGDVTVETVEDLQVLCMQASIDGEVITRGTQWGREPTTTKPEP